jgi:hypothetical protein
MLANPVSSERVHHESMTKSAAGLLDDGASMPRFEGIVRAGVAAFGNSLGE